MSGDAQAADQWREAQQRVSTLAREAGDDGMSVRVPSTPDWTARDLLAHMVGVGVDAVNGDVPDDLNAEWTQGHIDARRDASVDDLLQEWQGSADAIEDFVRSEDPSPLGDVVIHEQDLRGALDQPGARDTPGLEAVRTQMLDMLDDAIDDSLPPLELSAQDADFSWTSSGDGSPGARLEAPLFDLTRAALSRRTEQQLREWTVAGDVGPYLDALGHLGPLPDQPLPE